MRSLEESIAMAMDCDDPGLVQFLPYILQDFNEIGTSAEAIARIIRENRDECHRLRVLDLGCGKGATLVGVAETLGCDGVGIDGIPEFVETARSIAGSKGLVGLSFVCGDIRNEIAHLPPFDVIVLGSIGPVFGDHRETMEAMKRILAEGGMIILDDGCVDDGGGFSHPLVVERSALLDGIDRAGMRIVREYTDHGEEVAVEYDRQMDDIIRRCGELAKIHPESGGMFEGFVRKQKAEYSSLVSGIQCSTMVIERK